MITPDESLVDEIRQERNRQIEKWGGAEHDDEHFHRTWNGLIKNRAETGFIDIAVRGDGASYRRRLVQVAALAVAAIEAYDREAGTVTHDA